MSPQENLTCPRCGLALPPSAKTCPECGKELARPIPVEDTKRLKENRQRNIIATIASVMALSFAVATFQLAITSLFIAFIVPGVAFYLIYVWERNRGLKPGWQFYALSAVGIYAGGTFGFIFVLVPALVYFLLLRYRLNRTLRASKV